MVLPLNRDDVDALKAAANDLYTRLSLTTPNGAAAHEKANILMCLTRITNFKNFDPDGFDGYWRHIERARKFLSDLESGSYSKKRISAADLIDDLEIIRKV